MINKKIASEVAVGIVLIVALIVGAIFWMQNKDVETAQMLNDNVINNLPQVNETKKEKANDEALNENKTEKLKISENFVADIIKNNSLNNAEKNETSGTYWKRDDNKIICLNTDATDYSIGIMGRDNVYSKIKNIVSYLKQEGFTENKYNFLKNDNTENDPSIVGLEKDTIKCIIAKQINDIKKDVTKSQYTLEISCAELTKLDQDNFENFYGKVNEMGSSPIVCINKNNGRYLLGGLGGYDDSIGVMAGASLYGKNIDGKWKLFGTNDIPPCSFVDGFDKDVFNGKCYDGKTERQIK